MRITFVLALESLTVEVQLHSSSLSEKEEEEEVRIIPT